MKRKEYTVKVHPKYMVVLPKDVRETLSIRVGDKVDVKVKDHKAEITPLKKASIKAVRETHGMFKIPKDADIDKVIEKSVVLLAKDFMVKKSGKSIR